MVQRRRCACCTTTVLLLASNGTAPVPAALTRAGRWALRVSQCKRGWQLAGANRRAVHGRLAQKASGRLVGAAACWPRGLLSKGLLTGLGPWRGSWKRGWAHELAVRRAVLWQPRAAGGYVLAFYVKLHIKDSARATGSPPAAATGGSSGTALSWVIGQTGDNRALWLPHMPKGLRYVS